MLTSKKQLQVAQILFLVSCKATNFSDKGQYEEFLKMIQGRSLIRFDTMVNSSHKILTLSTCYNNWEKMVVHGKLVKQEKRY